MASKAEELARLERELVDMKARLPEHCSGTEGYVGIHHASPELLARIEELEEKIKELRAAEDREGSAARADRA